MASERSSLSISVRRHFVDNFFFSHKNLFSKDSKVIDIGGKKVKKRGLFDANTLSTKVTYVNIEKKDEPDILADATKIPLPDNSFDVALMGELLEHVPEPKLVLKEAHRLLKPHGVLLATVPFLYPIHADPYDFGRYTEHFWHKAAEEIGFKQIEIARQGGMFAVLALMIQHLFRAKGVSWRPIQSPLVSFCMWLDRQTSHPLLRAWTTGYGIVMHK